jgi:phage internal scaffolding protein
MMEVRHPYNRDRRRLSKDFSGEETRTKQSFKDECDINRIMHKFQKTGQLNHLAKYGPTYGDASSVDLLDAMTTLANAQTMYDDLPSSVRKKFHGPAEFLAFVEDEKNAEEMVKLGLAARHEPPEPLLVRMETTEGDGPNPTPE